MSMVWSIHQGLQTSEKQVLYNIETPITFIILFIFRPSYYLSHVKNPNRLLFQVHALAVLIKKNGASKDA